jgi:hypothetical protein
MSTGAAIRQGFALARRIRSAVWILLIFNLGLGAIATLPIYRGILEFTGHSLMSETLLKGFSVDWLVDFSFANPSALSRYAEGILVFALLAIPVNTVLAGGVLGAIKRLPGQPMTLADFFQDASEYAFRLLRLMVIGLVFYWLAFHFVYGKLGAAVNRWTEHYDDRSQFFAHLGLGLFLLLVVILLNMIVDFARVRIVHEDGVGAAEAFLSSTGFAIGRLRRALVVYAVPSLCGVALLGIYRLILPWHLVNTQLAGITVSAFREPLTLALLFMVQQLVMFGRFWFRAATWAGEWSYYASLHITSSTE